MYGVEKGANSVLFPVLLVIAKTALSSVNFSKEVRGNCKQNRRTTQICLAYMLNYFLMQTEKVTLKEAIANGRKGAGEEGSLY